MKESERAGMHKDPKPTESYRMVIWDARLAKPKPIPVQKEYEIWIGYYHLGQGYSNSTAPELVGRVKATSFKVACWIHVLETQLDSVKKEMLNPNQYLDITVGDTYFNAKTVSNTWLGKYYETEEEARNSFKGKY